MINTHITAENQFCCLHCKHKVNLAGENTHIQTDEQKINRKLSYCDICGKEVMINLESNHNIPYILLHRNQYGIVFKK